MAASRLSQTSATTNNSRQTSKQPKEKKTFKCSLCFDDLKDPRLLDCYHSFCNECLVFQIEAKGNSQIFECSVCKYPSKIPEGDEGFPKNFFVFNQDGQSSVKCDVCGEKTRAEFFCVVCDQNYCSFCLRIHSKLQGTKGHRIVSIDEKGSKRVSQSAALCNFHNKLELKYFCVTCKIPICVDCNMTVHKSHKCKDASEAVTEYKEILSSALGGAGYDEFIEEIANKKRNAKKLKTKRLDHEEELREAISKQSEIFHKMVDEIQEECFSKVMRYSPDDNETKNLEKKRLQFLSLYDFSKLLLEQGSDIDIIMHGIQLTEKLGQVTKDHVTVSVNNLSLRFSQGLLMKEKVRDLFGIIVCDEEGNENEEARLLKCFDCQMDEAVVTGIACLSNGMAWICFGNEGRAKLYDDMGQICDSIETDHKLDDVSVDEDNIVYLSCNAKKKVVVRNGHKYPETFLQTKSCARGLTLDKASKTLIVSLTEKDVFYNCSENPSASVVKMQGMKKEKKVYGRNTMKYPARIAQIPVDGCIAISDWIALQVIVLDHEGNQLNSFDGGSKEYMDEEDFIPRGICCDSKGKIYVVNNGANNILRLNSSGQFEKNVIDLDGCWSIACDARDRLWIGTQEGKIFIYQI